MTTTKIDLDELERKAREASTQDEWQWRPRGEDDVLEGIHDAQVVLFPATVGHVMPTEIIASSADREHIAANSPPVTLALVARIRELEVVADELVNAYDGEGYPSAAVRILEILEKGAVLP